MIRITILLAAVLVFAGGVLYRAGVAERETGRKVVSILSEWEKFGKPVDLHRISRGDMIFTTKISGILRGDGRIEAYVNLQAAKIMRPGQPFHGSGGGLTVRGTVSAVTRQVDLNTGLYRVLLQTVPTVPSQRTIIAARVETSRLHNVVRIPGTAVIRENGGRHVWVVKDGKAAKRAVKTGKENDACVQALSGIAEGETVAVSGTRKLADGDRVRTRDKGRGQTP